MFNFPHLKTRKPHQRITHHTIFSFVFSLLLFLSHPFHSLFVFFLPPDFLFKNMEILRPGVLVKLLEETRSDEMKSNDNDGPELLQIRSIVPILAEGDDDLWPKQGFYLEVSDSSHAMYVSLPHEQANMVLCDELRLGQLIFVEKIEKGSPVPMLRGIRPVPGRFPCIGKPEDLASMDDFGSVSGVSEIEKKPKERFSSLTGSRAGLNGNGKDGCKSRNCDVHGQVSNVMKGFGRDCDPASTTVSSSLSAPTIKRRSWNGIGVSGYSVSSKPTARRRSTYESSIQFSKYDSSDGNSDPKTKTPKSVKSSTKNTTPIKSMKNCESLNPAVTFSHVNNKELEESKMSWNALPQSLAKLGKDVERCRDLALLVATEALQEASVAERLLKCLNTYLELKSSKEKEKLQTVDLFLKLQEDLARTRLILQSLTNTRPTGANDMDKNSQKSTKETLKLAMDRKKNTTLWIKAALASDLIPSSTPSFPNNKTKRSSASKTRDTTIVKQKRNICDVQVEFEIETKKDNSQDWIKGNAFCVALELTNSLDYECRTWFLGYGEKYLDEVKSKTMSLECSDGEVAEMMSQIKKVSDWLEVVFEKEMEFPRHGNEDSQVVEGCGRLRSKIYEVLLKHVERTSVAWENMSTMVEVHDHQ